MDVEEFIDLVRERPCLYNNTDALSKNKKEKEKNWKEIAEKMEITSELAKCKWKNLKDNYSKHLKGTTATTGQYLKYLHWAWAPNMEFMKKHFMQGMTNVDHHNNQEDNETEYADSAHSSSRSEGRSEEVPNKGKIRRQAHMSRRSKSMASTHKVFQYMGNGADDCYDATDLIFLGYAKAIKTFSIRRQAEIKLKIAKIITEEEVAQYEENSVYPERPVYYSHSPSPVNDPLNPKMTNEIQVKIEDSL